MKKYLIFDLDGTLTKPRDINVWNDFLRKISQEYPEKFEEARYKISPIGFFNAKKILEQLEFSKQDIKTFEWELNKEILNSSHGDLFPWVKEVVDEVSQKFQLFLSTRSSDTYAVEILVRWKIWNNFWSILWSSKIQKWNEHIKYFSEFTQDKNFSEHAIFIWDGENDEAIAKSNNIDFIHVPYGVSKQTLKEIEKFNR